MRTINGAAKANGIALPMAARHRELLRDKQKPEPRDVGRLADAIEADYQFKLAGLVLTSLVQSARVRIDVVRVEGADNQAEVDRAKRLADNLMTRWREALPKALKAIGHGRAAFERTYAIDPASGLALVAGLDYLPFEQTRLKLDAEGRFAGIELWVDSRAHLLEPARAWWFALDATALEPHGKSRYLGAALEVYRRRRDLERLEKIWYAKFAIGHAVARAPERDEIDPHADPADPNTDPIEVLRQRCQEIESGGVLVLSSRTRADGKFLYDYAESSGQRDGTALEDRRRQLDTAALRSLGVPERAITQDGDTGSYALAAVHREVLFKTCEGILDQLATSFQKHVIDKAVAINWPTERRPRLVLRFEPLGDESRERRMALAADIIRSPSLSPAIAGGPVDLRRLLEEGAIPLTAEDSAKAPNGAAS